MLVKQNTELSWLVRGHGDGITVPSGCWHCVIWLSPRNHLRSRRRISASRDSGSYSNFDSWSLTHFTLCEYSNVCLLSKSRHSSCKSPQRQLDLANGTVVFITRCLILPAKRDCLLDSLSRLRMFFLGNSVPSSSLLATQKAEPVAR